MNDEVVDLTKVIKLDDFEPIARTRLSSSALAYYEGGAADEITLKNNVAAFRKRRLRPRVLVDVARVDPSTDWLGTRVRLPVGLAPTALTGRAHPEGEVAAARAAAAAGVVFCPSMIASSSLEEIAEADGPRWFQLYVSKDRGLSKDVVERAAARGYTALVLTVDLPVVGYRDREFGAGNEVTYEELGNLRSIEGRGGELSVMIDELNDPSLTWQDLEWIRGLSNMPLVIKGILTGEDARLAVECGASGIVVSNHGGRQLDRVPASIDVLEEIVHAVEGRAEVYLDGGVRRGTDVLVALALGAKGVFIGRPYLYALAAAGEAGVARALEIMEIEIANAMALLGVRSVGEITRTHTS